jgi:hypothetical protein
MSEKYTKEDLTEIRNELTKLVLNRESIDTRLEETKAVLTTLERSDQLDHDEGLFFAHESLRATYIALHYWNLENIKQLGLVMNRLRNPGHEQNLPLAIFLQKPLSETRKRAIEVVKEMNMGEVIANQTLRDLKGRTAGGNTLSKGGTAKPL